MNESSQNGNSDSQTILNQLIVDYLRDQKRKHRWRWIMRALLVFLLILLAYRLFIAPSKENEAHAGLIDINGQISDTRSAGSENFFRGLQTAYKNKALKALIIRINSPGGSPVQADYIYNAIRYYRKKYPAVKIYAVCVDTCASAAYYIAAAADEIYASPSSLVGSIGVVYNGFGFVDTLQKLGVSRRIQTAGINKGFLDPFSPVAPEQTQFLQAMLNDIHQIFIERVKQGRGNRLLIDDQTFSGLFWTGLQAKTRGLVDGFASSEELARDQVKVKKIVDYSHKQTVFERMSKSIGTAIADELPKALGFEAEFKA